MYIIIRGLSEEQMRESKGDRTGREQREGVKKEGGGNK